MPSTPRGRRAPPLAPGGCRLPPLSAVPRRVTVRAAQHRIVPAAVAMVRSGAATGADWDPTDPTPGALVERALRRAIRRFGEDGDSLLPGYVFLRPWSVVLGELLAPEIRAGESRWVIGIECDETRRLAVEPLARAFGEAAAGALLSLLMAGTPMHVDDGCDLEWILEGWEMEDPDGSPEEREIAARGAAGAAESRRIDTLSGLGHALGDAALNTLPSDVRRAALALRALQRRAERGAASPATAWQETEDVEWSMPRPALRFVWAAGGALDHAADQADFYRDQGDGGHEMPQQMWLLDPADPDGFARGWAWCLQTIRAVRAASRLLRRIGRRVNPDPPSR